MSPGGASEFDFTGNVLCLSRACKLHAYLAAMLPSHCQKIAKPTAAAPAPSTLRLLLMHFHKARVFLKPENPLLNEPHGFRQLFLALVDLDNVSTDLAKKLALRFALGL